MALRFEDIENNVFDGVKLNNPDRIDRAACGELKYLLGELQKGRITREEATQAKLKLSKYAVTELFKEISVKVADRPGGYTRIIKTGHRLGDNAEMCFIELVDYNENMAKTAAKKATRTRRSKKSAATAEAPAAEAAATEATTEEAPKAE